MPPVGTRELPQSSASPDQQSGRQDGSRRDGVLPGNNGVKTPSLRALRYARGRKRMGMARGLTRVALALLAVVIGALAAHAQAPKDKPRVPPGVDPGGVAVAIIGSGIDYTDPLIAKRLARDGEGEIIGWDFVDDDRRPYAACSSEGSPSGCRTIPKTLIGIAGLSRLIVLRTSLNRPETLVQAVQMAERSPARLVLVSSGAALSLQFVHEAAARHPRLLFIAAVDPSTMAGESVVAGKNFVAVPSRPDEAWNEVATAAAFAATITLSISPGTRNAELVDTVRAALYAASKDAFFPKPSVGPSPSTGTRGSGSRPPAPPR